MTPFRSERLVNGVVVNFFDRSNRYFGDYHRVRVEVRLLVPRPDHEAPLTRVKSLERMGVAGADVATVRSRLAEDFWRHAGRYLAHAEYPERLLAAETTARHRLRPVGR